MRIIIAPAKKMITVAVDGLFQFLEQADRLKVTLLGMSPKDLQALGTCNDTIAGLNIERLGQWNRSSKKCEKPGASF